MPASVHIEDGDGTGRMQHITSEGAGLVASGGCPPLLQQKCRIFREYLEDSAGSNDMDVAGTLTGPHDFYISANADADRYITAVNFYAGYGATGELFEWFDRGGALPNGCQFYYETLGEPVYIHDAITTNSDLLRLCVAGIMRSDWESRDFAALNDYGYICTVNLLQMIPPYGVKLDRGTTERLVFAIRDDITAETDAFNAIAYGFERFE